MTWLGFAALAVMLLAGQAASASGTTDRVAAIKAAGRLRVCIWPDYYAISWRNPKSEQLQGIDIDMSAAFAKDLGVAAAYVETSFPNFMAELEQDRCDIAMFGVGVTPARAARVDYSEPYLRSSIFAVTTKSHPRIKAWGDIDQKGIVVVVQQGTYMEPAMEKALKNASLTKVMRPQEREDEVRSGRGDVFMTDFPYGQRMLATHDWAVLLEPPAPFAETDYAYAIAKEQPAWLARVNAFVAAVKVDGRLKAAADRHKLTRIALFK